MDFELILHSWPHVVKKRNTWVVGEMGFKKGTPWVCSKHPNPMCFSSQENRFICHKKVLKLNAEDNPHVMWQGIKQDYMGHRGKPLVIYCLGIWVISTRSHIQSLFPLFPALKPIWPLVTTNYSLTMSPFLLRWWTSLFLCVGLQRMNDKFLEDRGKIFSVFSLPLFLLFPMQSKL